jgi:ligand-binding SRPBCC domain-containing protein
MPTIVVETDIRAPIELTFDLARDVETHCITASFTGERAVGGVTSGLLALGDTVTFEGVHLGVRQRLAARIFEFTRPSRFAEEMLSGAFSSLRHVHEFAPSSTGTLMRDTLTWRSPLGILGRIADRLFLVRHMLGFVRRRNLNFKVLVESKAAEAA